MVKLHGSRFVLSVALGASACAAHAPAAAWLATAIPVASGDTVRLGAPAPLHADSSAPERRFFTPVRASGLRVLSVHVDSAGLVRVMEARGAGGDGQRVLARALRAQYGPPSREWGETYRVQVWRERGPWEVLVRYERDGRFFLSVIEREPVSVLLFGHNPSPTFGLPWTARDSACRRGYPELC
jgi:hypothetical protein